MDYLIAIIERHATVNIIANHKYPSYVIWDPRQPAKNPIYNCRIIKLYCRTGYHLAITPSGQVEGLSGNKELYGIFPSHLIIEY